MEHKALWALLVGVVTLLLASCGSEPTELGGFVRTPTPNVASASLPDVSREGAPLPLQADPGELLLVYFGYTGCPDVCPTTLADIRTAFKTLGDDAGRVDVAMATIDPERDTDEVLTGYVQSFVPGAHALRTADVAELRSVADMFGADFDVSVAEDGGIEVLHTGHVYVVDGDGGLLVTWPFGTSSDAMASDMRILLAEA